MFSVIIDDWKATPTYKEVDMPIPKSGQVLIKVFSAAINPADNAFLKGKYSSKRKLPNSPGLEGSGLVIQTGGGLLAWRLKGKRVAFVTSDHSNGSWSQYVTTDATRCIALDDDITYDEGAYGLCNPMTVMCFQDVIQTNKYDAIIQTAACSALCKMNLRHFTSKGIKIINIVRKQEQVDILKNEEKAEYVLNSEEPDFQQKLKELCDELKPKCLLDAVSGELTSIILKNMPNNSTAYVYGSLSLQNVQVDSGDVIFKGKLEVKGLWVTSYLWNKSLYQKYRITCEIQKYLKTTLRTNISAKFKLSEINDALQHYKTHMSEGKCVLKPFDDETS